MAQKTRVTLVDDVNGEEIQDGGETVTFGLDGVTYEIDLSDANAAHLRSVFEAYTSAGRKTSSRATGRGRPSGAALRSSGSSVKARAVREWAASQGIALSPRGRIPADVVKRYEDAQG